MQADIRPSRIAASVIHPPIQKPEQLATSYKDWGSSFPTKGITLDDVRANIDYTISELDKWEDTMDVRVDDTYYRVVNSGSLWHMSSSVTEDNKAPINNALEKVLAPMQPWVGTIIQDDIEYSDRQMAWNKSCWTAYKTVIDLNLCEAIPLDWDGIRAQSQSQDPDIDRKIAFQKSVWLASQKLDLAEREKKKWLESAQHEIVLAERYLQWHSYRVRIDY